jgi:hypothetical protein
MRDYASISPQFWIGKTGKSLRGDMAAQVLAMYLMSCPHSNMIGVYHCPIIYMAHETGMTIEGASKALASLIEAGFCEYEESSETVFVVRMAAFQVGEQLKAEDKRVMGIRKAYQNIAEPRMKSRFFDVYKDAFFLSYDQENEDENKGLTSPSKAPPKQLTGTGTGAGTKPSVKSASPADRRFAEFWLAYPNKVGKDAARKAFDKRKPDDALLDVMLAAIEAQKHSEKWVKDGGQYIPNPATWLNHGRWMDESDGVGTGTSSLLAGGI